MRPNVFIDLAAIAAIERPASVSKKWFVSVALYNSISGPASKWKFRSLGTVRTVQVPPVWKKGTVDPSPPHHSGARIVGPGGPLARSLSAITWTSFLRTCSLTLPLDHTCPEPCDTMTARTLSKPSTPSGSAKPQKAPPKFPCSHCDKVFKRSEHRARHERSRMHPTKFRWRDHKALIYRQTPKRSHSTAGIAIEDMLASSFTVYPAWSY